MIKLKPLTAKDFEEYYGKPPLYTMQGISFIDNGVVGVVAIQRIDRRFWLTVSIKRNDFAMKRALIRGWDIVKDMLKTPTYIAEDDLPTAAGFIRHFGFKKLHNDIWAM